MHPLLIWYEQRALHKFIFDTAVFYKLLFLGAMNLLDNRFMVKMPALLLADPD
ncbi:hypothetical protein HU727_022985 [Pseudomonas sp. SWRI153]|uniref:Uncharacterized protein n=1 Tax=Pseudomonas khorasanensis TaxID=2745508 RepID=A0A923JGW8_9PSED|nr:hypothetical protein [Pseudomonas khorasanensis]MBV4488456.1 hypothetical protein [Pseudomonas khorasanensis]